MEAQAANMHSLLSGLMDFSKVGTTDLKSEVIQMNAMVREICDGLKEYEKGRNIAFDIGDLPTVKGDPVLVRQVWVNLLLNAVKYTGKREHALIEVGARLPQGELAYFVKDNGDGFDMKYADKLFGVFQRLHSREDFDGNGIGLALAEKIISRHGGRIWAEGKPGDGATFYFSLPA